MAQPLKDEELCKLMVDTHGARFDGGIWDAFDNEVVPELPEEPSIADLGCGPGLFLFDLCQRLPAAHLYGFEASETMLDFAENLSWSTDNPRLRNSDLSLGIPAPDRQFDLVSMNFFLHQFEYPLPLLSETLRVLRERGLVWVYDWVRRPLSEYLRFWELDPGLPGGADDPSLAYRLFASHNRFTSEDWRYVFSQAGLVTVAELPRAGGQHALSILRRQPH